MKNLVYISGSTFPSSAANSIQVIKMCEEFSKYYNVTLFAKVNSNLVFSEDDVFDYYDCKKSFKIVLISSISNIHYSLKIFFSQILSKETILYSRNLFPVILLSIFFKKNIFFEAHIDPKNQPIYNRIFKFFIKYLNINFIAISAKLRRICSKYYNIKEEKILISHDAADHNKFKMKKKPIKTNSMVNVGYIGSIYPGRGVEVICELAKKNPKIIFNIIGGSNELSKKYKEKYNFKNLNFLGFIPYSKITDYFSNQNILIAPYQEKIGISGGMGINTASYMSPLKLFEYMASRRAIIVSKLPVLEEVVNSDCVMFCDPTEINSWNSALNKLINNDKLYNNLIDNSYKLFINNYTVEKRVENINSYINHNLK